MTFKNLFKSKLTVINDIIEKEIEKHFDDISCEIQVVNRKSLTNENKIVPFVADNYHELKLMINGKEVRKRFNGCNSITVSTKSIMKICQFFNISIEEYTETLMSCLIDNLKYHRDPYFIHCIPIIL